MVIIGQSTLGSTLLLGRLGFSGMHMTSSSAKLQGLRPRILLALHSFARLSRGAARPQPVLPGFLFLHPSGRVGTARGLLCYILFLPLLV